MRRLEQLHLALAGHSEPRWKVAEKLNRPAPWISTILRGTIKVSQKDRLKLAEILGKPVNMLFPPEQLKVAS